MSDLIFHHFAALNRVKNWLGLTDPKPSSMHLQTKHLTDQNKKLTNKNRLNKNIYHSNACWQYTWAFWFRQIKLINLEEKLSLVQIAVEKIAELAYQRDNLGIPVGLHIASRSYK